jgi:RNA polymerase sigma-70 factor (ECF subfamily)
VSPEELVSAARHGNQEAFTQLYGLYRRDVLAVGYTILRKIPWLSEDHCQDTFTVAFTRLEQFNGRSTFRTWLNRIAVNQALGTLRKYNAKTHGDLANISDIDPQAVAVYDRSVQTIPAHIDTEHILADLSPQDAALLRLTMEGWDMEELARSTGRPVGSVKSHLHRARQRARELVGGRTRPYRKAS